MSINRSRDTDLTRSLSFYIPVSVSVNIGKPRNYLCRCVTRYRVSQMGRGNRERSFRYNVSRKVLACVRSTLLRSIIDKLEVFPKYTEETCVSRSTIGTRFECFTLDELSVKKKKTFSPDENQFRTWCFTIGSNHRSITFRSNAIL